MAYETVRFEREETEHGTIAHVTLDRPEVRNAIDLTMIRELGSIIDEIALCLLYTSPSPRD